MAKCEVNSRGDFQGMLQGLLYSDDQIVILAISDKDLACPLSELVGTPVALFDAKAFGFETVSGQTVKLSDLSGPPTCTCVAAASSVVAQETLSRLSLWWQAAGGVFPPQLHAEAGSTMESIACAVLRTLVRQTVERVRRVSSSVLDLHHQIFALREQHEESGAIIEGMRPTTVVAEPFLHVACQPTGDCWISDSDGALAVFTFPFRAQGLSQIDLHFHRPTDSNGWLFVSVIAVENEHVLGKWRVPYEQMGGWLPLIFPRPLSTTSHFLRLQIEWHTEVGLAPRLSLSD